MWHSVRLPDLRFSEYFIDQNHLHNLDEEDVIDAVIGRTILISGPYTRNAKRRRKILAKTDSEYITVICEEAEGFWWVISAFPSSDAETVRAKSARVGRE